jgi:hypothetical protein
MIKVNEHIKQDPIDFKDVIVLGFKSRAEHDSVFQDEHGVPYIITNLELGKVYEFDWDQLTRTVILWKTHPCDCTDDDNVKYYVKDLQELKNLIQLLKKI